MNLNEIKNMLLDFYSYYLVDFSMGKTSRLLIGSIVSLLTDKPTAAWIHGFAVVVLFLTLLATALIIGKVIKSASDEMRPCLLVLTLFFVSGSFTLYGFSKFFGMLDIYMYIAAMLAVVFAPNKHLRWLIPALSVAGIFVNYSFAISFFPIIALVTLYTAATQKRKGTDSTVFALTVALSVAAGVFCVFYGSKTMNMTFDEIWQSMEQRSGLKFDYKNIRYFDFYFFGNGQGEAELQFKDFTPLELIKILPQIVFMFGVSSEGAQSILAITLFMIAAFWTVWIMCIKNSETAGRKFIYLCFMLSVLFIPVCCIVSTDWTRWIQAGILTQFGLMYYMFYMKDEPFTKTMQRLKELFSGGRGLALAAVWLAYASSIQTTWSV